MEVYTSEHEQVEALRRWWQKNGKSVLIGIALALVAFFGWQTWQQQQAATAAAAAAQYEALLAAASDREKATEIGRAIISSYPDSVYAAFANMTLAASAVDGGDLDAAEAHLRWVVENSDDARLKALASIRLARVELGRGNPDAALQQLAGVTATEMDGYLLETRGDIYAAKGERAQAREAYRQALDAYTQVPSKQPLVTMKLNDLAAQDENQ